MNYYARRDKVALGDLYVSHVGAMTAENLHDESDIAAELAHRDARIRELEDLLKASADSARDAQRRMRAENNILRDQRNAAEDALRAAGFRLVTGEWRSR